jgi:hypothetical protein
MTTHAKYARGTTPAHGLSIHGKIDKLIATAQSDLDALLRTKELMTAVAKNGKVHSHETVLARAVDLDSERREARPAKPAPAKKPKRYSKPGSSQRKRTAKFLARFANTPSDKPYMPTGSDSRRVSVLIQHGYLKAQGEGYVRTDKVFTP